MQCPSGHEKFSNLYADCTRELRQNDRSLWMLCATHIFSPEPAPGNQMPENMQPRICQVDQFAYPCVRGYNFGGWAKSPKSV